MVRHWLNTPAGSYLGSSYGSNLKDMLQRPILDSGMDEVVAKLKEDIPILSVLGAGAVNVLAYESTDRIDGIELVIEVAGRVIPVPKD